MAPSSHSAAAHSCRRSIATSVAIAAVVSSAGCGSTGGTADLPSTAPATTSPSVDAAHVDLVEPSFSAPTTVTNPWFPISALEQVVQLGEEAGHALRHEITLLPDTKIIEWNGRPVENLVSQFVAYKDGRLLEVAYDYFAQADDGSVWYFGEDVYNYEDGVVADTDGTWLAGKDGPPGMIMPADPRAGDVYRPENIPDLVFEEVTVKAVDQTVDGPRGSVAGAIRVQERLVDGVLEDKVFAPGYGEFEASVPTEDELTTVAIAVPIDAEPDPAGERLAAVAAAAADAVAGAAAGDISAAREATERAVSAWAAYPAADAPPLLRGQMDAALAALSAAMESEVPSPAHPLADVELAALEFEGAALDLRMRSESVTAVDLGRLDVWIRRLQADARGVDGVAPDDISGLVRGDLATLTAIWDRVEAAVGANFAAAMQEALVVLRDPVAAGDIADLRAAATDLLAELRSWW